MLGNVGRGSDETVQPRPAADVPCRREHRRRLGRLGSEVELTEPTRAALITLAGDVLGRLAAEEVPASLRAVARFAPGKRHRLGGTALAAALDGDEQFRQGCRPGGRDVVTRLVTAVREGTDTAAADPVDIAMVPTCCARTAGADALAAANGRWRRDRATTPPTGPRRRRAARRVAQLRARSRGEPARVRDADAAARRDADAELAEARRAVRERTARAAPGRA